MTTTTYYDLNIVEGTDIVNPLIVDNPNYEKIDETMHNNAVAGVTIATEITNATVHAITRENSDCSVIRFIATSRWKAGDTVTVDGVPVTALLPSGETLPDGAYVINANVLCILTGTNLTFYVGGKKVENASDVIYNDTNVEQELNKINASLETINKNLTVRYNAETDKIQIFYNGNWVDCFEAGIQIINFLTKPTENWIDKSNVIVTQGTSSLKFTATSSSSDNDIMNAMYSEKLYASSGKKLRVVGTSNLSTTYANLIGISTDGVTWSNIVNGGTYTPTQFSAEIPLDGYTNGFYLRINTNTVKGRVVFAEFTKFEIS